MLRELSRDAYGKVIHRNFKRSNSNQPLTELLSPHAGTIIQALVGDAVPDMEPGKDGCVSAILGTAVPACDLDKPSGATSEPSLCTSTFIV